MAAFSPILKRSGSGAVSWASIVATGRVDGLTRTVAKKNSVQWQDGASNLGVETRIYFVDGDHPEFEHIKREERVSQTKYWHGADTGGKTVALKHVPYRPGEMLEQRRETVMIDGVVVGTAVVGGGFSQMACVDGSELTSTIFGKLVLKFANGVPAPAPKDGGLARMTNVRVKCPDFFKTGAGKEYVRHEGLPEKIDEALEKIKNEGEFGLIKETIPLHRGHVSMLELFKEAYGAGVAAAVAEDKKFKFNAEAAVFVPKTRGGDDWGRIMVPVCSDLLENKTTVRFTAKPIYSLGHGTAWE